MWIWGSVCAPTSHGWSAMAGSGMDSHKQIFTGEITYSCSLGKLSMYKVGFLWEDHRIWKPEDANGVKEGPCSLPWKQKYSLYHWAQLVSPISSWPFCSSSCSYEKLWSPSWSLSCETCIQPTYLSVGLTYKANAGRTWPLLIPPGYCLGPSHCRFQSWWPLYCSVYIATNPLVSASTRQPEYLF